jgi:hypothetical protein
LKFKNTPLKKFWIVLSCVIAGACVLIILFISPIVKYLVEKYDERYTGRQITMDWAYVNPFTGFVHFSNLKIYEAKKDTLFFTAKGVSANLDLMKLFSGTYELSEVTLDAPRGTVIQRKQILNFDDLIQRFSASPRDSAKEPVHLNILNVKINHGEFYYREKVIPIYYAIKDLNLESSGKRWDSDTIRTKFSFLSQNEKGGVKGDFTINVKNQDYRVATEIRNFNLEIIRQYLWELINYGMFSAHLDAKIKATGNLKDPANINLTGRISVKDFQLGKTKRDNYAAFDQLVLAIDDLSPKHDKFLFDSVILSHPYFKYEAFDSLDNLQMLFGKNGSNISDVTSQQGRFNLIIEIGRYLKKLASNFFQSHYRINTLRVTDGDLKYSDFSLSEQFTIGTNALGIRADSVDKNNKRMKFYIKSGIKPYGDLSVTLSINPKDSGDFDMFYHINKVPVTVFNPYLISYTSFPLDRGTIEFNGVWNVRMGEIKSVNHLLVIDPRVSKRLKNKDIKWLPLPLIMTFVRERANVIDYEIPISGNLKNPHFHLHNVIFDVLKNIFVKPVTIPYGISVKSTVSEIENTLTLKWDMRQFLLRPGQKKFVEKIAKFLKDDPKVTIAVYPKQFASKEKEYILFFEAKKKYFLMTHHMSADAFTREDSAKVDKMSIKDPRFMRALKVGSGAGDTIMFTIQEKCNNFVGHKKVDEQYQKLLKEREKGFQALFLKTGSEKKITMHPEEESIPYNGFSYFKIVFHGDIPKSLRKAYEDMHELDNEGPRKKYFGKNDPELDAASIH